MTGREFEAFQSAWEDYPSQDNEGFVPDRGSFKAGFAEGLKYAKAGNLRLREALEYVRSYCDDYAVAIEKDGAMDRSIWDVSSVVREVLSEHQGSTDLYTGVYKRPEEIARDALSENKKAIVFTREEFTKLYGKHPDWMWEMLVANHGARP